MIQNSMIPQEFVEKSNLTEKAYNGYIYSRVAKGMYGLPQESQISHDALVKHLEPYGYYPSIKKPGLWKHNIRPINFTLVVNDFGVKYSGKEHVLHLKAAPEKIQGNHRLVMKVVHWDSTKLGLWKRNGPTFNSRICTRSTTFFPTR